MQTISTRREHIKALLGAGAGALSLSLLESSCSASTILNDIDQITTDALAVTTAVTDSASAIPLPIFSQIETYLSGVQAATVKALAIDAGAAKLTAAQATEIIELYANYAVAQIPGVPPVVGASIALVEIAINTLVNLLKPATTNPAVTIPVTVSRYKRFQAERHNGTLKSKIKSMHASYAKMVHV